jgi:hypothetical protein
MNRIANEKCFIHRQREAVALCPECRRYFCRECVTEHDDRAICASCLQKIARVSGSQRRQAAIAAVSSAMKIVLGLLALWLIFFYLGLLLLRIPSSVHEGSIWGEYPRSSSNSHDTD